MALDQKKYEHKHEAILRDVRPLGARIAENMASTSYSSATFISAAVAIYINDWALVFSDLIVLALIMYFLWLLSRDKSLVFKLPLGSKYKDPNNGRDGKSGKSEGILYLGNAMKSNEEVWFTNSDIRTHFLYLGTTGAGKTEGLKSLVSNAMSWGSGFVYVDGKADTDLWSSLSSLVRRFGRDDDLLILNYMTGNSDAAAPSNTMNPFSSGSASYLTNMLVSLMPDGGGDNAMWKERAVSLVGAMMPALTWKRDNQEVPMSVRTIRDYLSLNKVIQLSRDEFVPKEILAGMIGYLDTLPGFMGDAYDDDGNVKPPGPDTPPYNAETASQQHGYLAMQFTRSLQSLGDDYGYIFDTQAADVDMVDIVLNRRILVVLVPALEKSGDEIANLGKIVSASIKGMMGSALGSTVEGTSATVIENKPTHSNTPFMTIFDEVGYYVAEGMAVMAAQARSLGFSLVFAGQDLPAMKKRVKEEAMSITANCNIKLFGKLEDPTETKDFFEKTVGSAMVVEVSGFQMGGSSFDSYQDTKQASVQTRPRASYDGLRGFKEGQAIVTFGETVVDCAIFYSNPGFAKAMRVTRFMSLPPTDAATLKHAGAVRKLRDLMVNKTWTAKRSDVAIETSVEIKALNDGFVNNNKPSVNPVEAGIAAIVQVHAITDEIPPPSKVEATAPKAQASAAPVAPAGKSSSPSIFGGKPDAAATPKTEAPVEQAVAPTSTAKPSIFGAAPAAQPIKTGEQAVKPEIKEEPAQQQQAAPVETPQPTTTHPQEAKTEGNAKPSIFGAKPVTAQTPAEQSPPPAPITTTPIAATPIKTDEAIKPEAKAKPSIFGAKPEVKEEPSQPAQQEITPVETPQPTPTQEVKTEGNAKPAIFGAKPVAAQDPVEQQPTAAPIAAPPVETPPAAAQPIKTDEQAVKPSIFGTAQAAQKTPVERPLATAPIAETPPAAPVEAPQPTTPPPREVNTEGNAKPAIFGVKPAATQDPVEQQPTAVPIAEAPTPTQEVKTEGNAKPAIFGTKPTAVQAPADQPPPTDQGNGGTKKPAIFSKKSDDSEKKDD